MKGGEDGLSKADIFEWTRRGKQIPKPSLSIEQSDWVDKFWQVRGICGGPDNPITPDIISQWERHTYNTLQKWQRDWMFGMDSAFRHAHGEVLKFHATRAQVKQDDQRDKARLNGRRNPRI